MISVNPAQINMFLFFKREELMDKLYIVDADEFEDLEQFLYYYLGSMNSWPFAESMWETTYDFDDYIDEHDFDYLHDL